MADFYLDPVTGDLDITNGIILVPNEAQEAAQRVKLAFGVNLGEFFANKTFGLPYLEIPGEDVGTNIRYMLGDKFPDTPRFVYETLSDYLNSLPFILSSTTSFEFNRKTRVFTFSYTAIVESGAEIVFPPFETTV